MQLRHGLGCACLVVALGAFAADRPGGGVVRVTPDAVQWTDIPGSPGVRMARLVGDPDLPGWYVIRIRFPPHVMSAPHWHANARYVTVLEGTWYAGTGDRVDVSRAVPLPAGSFMLHPKGLHHWDGSATDAAVVVQIIGAGPQATTEVAPGGDGWVRLPR